MENRIIQGDCLEKLKELPDGIADCCVTSPPYYGLRDYGTGTWVGGNPNCNHDAAKMSTRFERTMTERSIKQTTNLGSDVKTYRDVCPICGAIREDKQIGMENTPEEYIANLVNVFREVRRVLKDDGTLWLNIGDSYCNSNGYARASDQYQRKGRNDAPANDRSLDALHGAGYKTKDIIGIPWMLAFALRADGWYLRQDIIWHKPNPMPESVKDRCTRSHEYIFLLSKSPKYYFDYEAIQEEAIWKDDKRAMQGRIEYDGKRSEGEDKHAQKSFVAFGKKKHKNLQYNGQQNHSFHERRAEGLPDDVYPVRNKRDVWTISTQAIKDAHFATFPEKLVEPCILAGSHIGGVVLDPFFGSGTTGRVAARLNRSYIGIELNPQYIEIEKKRTSNLQMTLTGLI